ncbi:MAG TPA: adenosylhomocysteinase [Acidimicrobiales bacterium]|nr:adenosylhomocysteinase [Acidimicrobiales bacterium]
MGSPAPHDVADLDLAPIGRARVEWARHRMPVLDAIRSRFARERPFEGIRIGASLHVTAETAVLLEALAAGGAAVTACASNPLSTNDEVAAYLAGEAGVATFARRGEDLGRYAAHLDAVIDRRPTLTVDDGCDLVARLHGPRRDALGEVLAGTEDTRTGALRLRALAASAGLSYPVMALADAATRVLADNRLGTGQSTLDGIIRATNLLVAGSVVVVAGYGSCGKGVAARARGLGAIVIVTEVDPLRALEAVTDGYRVLPMDEAAPLGQVFVTATGNRDVLRREHLEVMRDGAVLANAGQFDVEIDVAALAGLAGSPPERARPMVDEFSLPGGRRLVLLAEGRIVNLALAEGHPPQVMDLSFSLQALACHWLLEHAARLPVGVHELPAAIDEEIARMKLEAMGVRLDSLTPAQSDYLATWQGPD